MPEEICYIIYFMAAVLKNVNARYSGMGFENDASDMAPSYGYS